MDDDRSAEDDGTVPAAIRALVSAEKDRLGAAADAVAARFWKEHNDARAGRPQSEHGRYGLRVERRKASLSIRWYEFRYVGGKGKKTVAHKMIAMGKGYKYKTTAFSKAQSWELIAIECAENELAKIRARGAILARFLQDAARYEKVMSVREDVDLADF